MPEIKIVHALKWFVAQSKSNMTKNWNWLSGLFYSILSINYLERAPVTPKTQKVWVLGLLGILWIMCVNTPPTLTYSWYERAYGAKKRKKKRCTVCTASPLLFCCRPVSTLRVNLSTYDDHSWCLECRLSCRRGERQPYSNVPRQWCIVLLCWYEWSDDPRCSPWGHYAFSAGGKRSAYWLNSSSSQEPG